MKIAMHNDAGIVIPGLPFADRNLSNVGKGRIYGLANDANFDAAHLSEPLTQFVTGVPDTEDLLATLEAMIPSVPVSRKFSFKTHNEKAQFQIDSNDADIREIGGKFQEVTAPGGETDSSTQNKGLAIVLDNDAGGEDASVQQYHVASLRNRLLRTEIYRARVLIDANDVSSSTPNWGASNTTADPDGDLLTAVDASLTARGVLPTVLVLGGTAALRRKIALRRQATSGGFATAGLSDAELATFLGLQKVVTLRTAYQSTSTAKSAVAGSEAYVYSAAPGLTTNDPSNFKRFVTTTEGGMFRVYVVPMLKQTLIAVEHYSRLVCTSTLGILSVKPTYT